MEVIGFDAARRRPARGAAIQIDGRSVRFRGAFDADKDRLTGLWEMKGAKAGWQPRIRLELVRA